MASGEISGVCGCRTRPTVGPSGSSLTYVCTKHCPRGERGEEREEARGISVHSCTRLL